MARQELERDDLLAEATALHERCAWTVPGGPNLIVGYRDNGALSLYFDGDTMFQFDSAHRLRRAFHAGQLFRSEGTTLSRLVRHRADCATALHRHDLQIAELTQFLDFVRQKLNSLNAALAAGLVHVSGQVPPDLDLRPRVCASLTEIVSKPIQLAPRLTARRR